MINEIFAKLPQSFVAGMADGQVSFYFSMGETKKTVVVDKESCTVSDGKTVDSADCVCKTSPEFFLKIWNEDYRPGMKDFLSGTIKSNDPNKLQLFLKSFGKES